MKTSFGNLTDSEIPVLIDFFATWCGPCQTLAPILEDVKKDLGEKVKIVKVDVDKNQALAQKFQVRGVPTLMLFKNGKQVWRQSGVLSRADIKNVIAALNEIVSQNSYMRVDVSSKIEEETNKYNQEVINEFIRASKFFL